MAMPVLATKLSIPLLRTRAAPRPSLIDHLAAGSIRLKLTLVSAPAGFGKSSLLTGWIAAAQRRDPL